MTENQELGQLRDQFTTHMHEGVNALATLGYNATRFRQMLLNEGDAVVVAHRLVMADGTEGLWRLKQMGRLDMSVEMWVLHPEYEELFDQTTRDRAYANLRAMDFNVDAHLRDLGTEK